MRAAIDPASNEFRLLEHDEVFRRRSERHVERSRKLSNRVLFAVGQHREHGPPRWVGQCVKGGVQGICRIRNHVVEYINKNTKSGTTLGPYELTGPLGKGGMGEVYRANDTSLNRQVAIKVLPTAFAQDTERLGACYQVEPFRPFSATRHGL